MIGGKLKELRESKGLLQREVAAKLDVDTAYISKMESDEKPVSRSYLRRLSRLFDVTEEELLTVWLADKIYDVAKDESVAIKALKAAEQEILKKSK
ncbi:MAG: helix-turn-helix transcriptional regulator [Bacteroidetes bacterium]|nr:helix-turn-helix transcriptional regulator [Bacteroidota bacterium]